MFSEKGLFVSLGKSEALEKFAGKMEKQEVTEESLFKLQNEVRSLQIIIIIILLCYCYVTVRRS